MAGQHKLGFDERKVDGLCQMAEVSSSVLTPSIRQRKLVAMSQKQIDHGLKMRVDRTDRWVKRDARCHLAPSLFGPSVSQLLADCRNWSAARTADNLAAWTVEQPRFWAYIGRTWPSPESSAAAEGNRQLPVVANNCRGCPLANECNQRVTEARSPLCHLSVVTTDFYGAIEAEAIVVENDLEVVVNEDYL